MAIGVWSSFKLFENVLASTKWAIYFCTQCQDREMDYSSEDNEKPTRGWLVLLARDSIGQRVLN